MSVFFPVPVWLLLRFCLYSVHKLQRHNFILLFNFVPYFFRHRIVFAFIVYRHFHDVCFIDSSRLCPFVYLFTFCFHLQTFLFASNAFSIFVSILIYFFQWFKLPKTEPHHSFYQSCSFISSLLLLLLVF